MSLFFRKFLVYPLGLLLLLPALAQPPRAQASSQPQETLVPLQQPVLSLRLPAGWRLQTEASPWWGSQTEMARFAPPETSQGLPELIISQENMIGAPLALLPEHLPSAYAQIYPDWKLYTTSPQPFGRQDQYLIAGYLRKGEMELGMVQVFLFYTSEQAYLLTFLCQAPDLPSHYDHFAEIAAQTHPIKTPD
ncbi:hypothetical protein COW36_15790 [bacterium (Candidatus Blackallbacteria) CG17_big_fil_post_rev_8_21_14_2_50_48_46]|uniref:DUF1795 domain-containing protein n=1 Tax=bacterium (Candidatus Blackallbacteria) CG17_big_fil_post_rev_8_21_14_2_50_48_46 TaxID=2014261 RepID=A0A2M7G214_9BACT|nr:MAG: hypothetical protein COW64_24320 [bacterium (Candidatus Blackallbacteria) CG18_big_fil_WC_8_21_14_2_50_49_26]PIW15807.1 MAG: hypothetical protein COW36_15790 [bacterium (Candidatus Blackallbacteria) CG17_big_fil_post_rev_8_21_14_2_50_48_46]PIW47792.1 MAG: hypothetical protein COW20_11485 [bacterium (Candidatus Blackallbacteria) CG13_big_fil_rev_8_21_14_2_50_49_14]